MLIILQDHVVLCRKFGVLAAQLTFDDNRDDH